MYARMMKHCIAIVLLSVIAASVSGFHVTSCPAKSVTRNGASLQSPRSLFPLASSPTSEADTGSDSATVPKAQTILDQFHESNLTFRIVVVGNGAILETTSKLGPESKTSVSPKTGEKLMTFASEDKSFEFHVKIEQIAKITFVTSERPLPDGEKKIMRVSRFLNDEGQSMCSLILADSSKESAEWFDSMSKKYGLEVNLYSEGKQLKRVRILKSRR